MILFKLCKNPNSRPILELYFNDLDKEHWDIIAHCSSDIDWVLDNLDKVSRKKKFFTNKYLPDYMSSHSDAIACSYSDAIACSYSDAIACSYPDAIACSYPDAIACSYPELCTLLPVNPIETINSSPELFDPESYKLSELSTHPSPQLIQWVKKRPELINYDKTKSKSRPIDIYQVAEHNNYLFENLRGPYYCKLIVKYIDLLTNKN